LGTQGASQGAWPAPLAQAHRMPRKHPYVSRRSATPRFGCAKQRKQNPGAKTRRGNEEVLLRAERADAKGLAAAACGGGLSRAV
jgi:hypothetical protein